MTWLVHFAGVRVSQTLQICSSGLNRPKNERKTKRKARNRTFSRKVTLWGLAIKFSPKFKGCLFANRKKTWWNGWEVMRLCNAIEIKNNEMIQSFLVETSWNQWFLSKKIFCIRRFRKKKMFSEIWPQSQGSQSKLTGRKVGSVKQHGGLRRLKRWLKSLTKFAHNIF